MDNERLPEYEAPEVTSYPNIDVLQAPGPVETVSPATYGSPKARAAYGARP